MLCIVPKKKKNLNSGIKREHYLTISKVDDIFLQTKDVYDAELYVIL